MRYKIVNRKKLLATALADLLGAAATFPFRMAAGSGPLDAESVRSILIIREAYLGDVVMTLPMLAPIRAKFPQARISFLTSSSARPALETNPYVDEIITYDAFWFYPTRAAAYAAFWREFRQRAFDLVIDARGDIRDILLLVTPPKSRYRVGYGIGGGAWMLTHVVPFERARHKVEFHLDIARFLGCECDEPTEWGFYLTPAEKAGAQELLRARGIAGPFVAAHPGSRMPLKRWPAERCATLYDRLIREKGLPLVIFGTRDELPFVEEILSRMRETPTVLAGNLGVRQLAAIFSRARVLVCNDSAPMHIAACVKTPTVALFGPSISQETGPYGAGHRVVEKDFPCRRQCDENTCRFAQHQACLQTLGVDEVFEAVAETLRSP